jgi:hypothetical protein
MEKITQQEALQYGCKDALKTVESVGTCIMNGKFTGLKK